MYPNVVWVLVDVPSDGTDGVCSCSLCSFAAAFPVRSGQRAGDDEARRGAARWRCRGTASEDRTGTARAGATTGRAARRGAARRRAERSTAARPGTARAVAWATRDSGHAHPSPACSHGEARTPRADARGGERQGEGGWALRGAPCCAAGELKITFARVRHVKGSARGGRGGGGSARGTKGVQAASSSQARVRARV